LRSSLQPIMCSASCWKLLTAGRRPQRRRPEHWTDEHALRSRDQFSDQRPELCYAMHLCRCYCFLSASAIQVSVKLAWPRIWVCYARKKGLWRKGLQIPKAHEKPRCMRFEPLPAGGLSSAGARSRLSFARAKLVQRCLIP
jgi:hypothetical protein